MCLLKTGHVTYRVHPPEDITLMKTDQELEVECYADGNRQKTVMVRPLLSSNTFLNLGNGFVPGFALDEHTNAHYLYPDVIAVDFSNIPYQKSAQPHYALNPASPNIEDIDPKRGGMPAIHSSDMDEPAPLEERQSRAFYSNQPDAPNYQPKSQPPIK